MTGPKPAFLIIGSTGNTGVGVVNTLSSLLQQGDHHAAFKDYRIIALTRNVSSSRAQEFTKFPNVEVVEKDWVYIDVKWLQDNNIKRIFIASHFGPTQFTDESLILNYAREAGVEYVVRISTTNAYIGPTTSVYHGRNHWAVEMLLSQPEFDAIKWTSLRPNGFIGNFVYPTQAWLAEYRKTGKQTPFRTNLDEKAPFAAVDPYEVGIIAAQLLTQEDVSKHASKKYVIAGPENLNGKQIVELLEKHAGIKLDDVEYRDTKWAEMLKAMGTPEYLIPSIATAPTFSWDGSSSKEADPTNPEILALYTPKNGALEAIDKALQAVQ